MQTSSIEKLRQMSEKVPEKYQLYFKVGEHDSFSSLKSRNCGWHWSIFQQFQRLLRKSSEELSLYFFWRGVRLTESRGNVTVAILGLLVYKSQMGAQWIHACSICLKSNCLFITINSLLLQKNGKYFCGYIQHLHSTFQVPVDGFKVSVVCLREVSVLRGVKLQ